MAFDARALGIVDMVRPDFHYGKSATANAAPFSGIVVHHTADKPAENLVRYGQRVDQARGGAFGYHFYVAKDGRIIQGAPLDKRTNHIKPPSHGARRGTVGDLSNANALGITLVGAEHGATPQQKASAEKLARALMSEYGISGERVFGHGDLQTDRQHTEGAELVELLRGTKVADAGGFSREALMQEARKRGLIKDGPSFSREELLQEARRRGLIKEGAEETGGDITPEQRIQEKAAVESAVGQVLGEKTPEVAAEEEAAKQLRLSYAEPDPEAPATRPREGIEPTDLIAATPPGAALAMIKEHLPQDLQDWLDTFVSQGTAFGLGDEIVGAATSAVGGDGAAARDAERARAKAFAEKRPIASGAAEILGGAIAAGPVGGGLVGAAKGLGTTARVGAGAIEGAAFGGAHGFTTGEGGFDNRLEKAATGVGVGAVAGGLLSRAGISLERFFDKRALAKAAPSLADHRAASASMMKEAENIHIYYKPHAVRDMQASISNAMDDVILSARIHPKTFGLSREIDKVINKSVKDGDPITFKKLIRMRQLAGAAAFEAKKGSDDARLAGQIRQSLDDFMEKEANMLHAAGGNVNGPAAVKMRREGAKMWHQFKKAEKVEDAIEDAVLRSQQIDSGGNLNSKVRTAMGNILREINKGKVKGWTQDEIAALKAAAKQGALAGLVRTFGKTSPVKSPLSAMIHGSVGTATGGSSLAIQIPIMATAEAARIAGERTTTKKAREVLQVILTGGKVPKSEIDALTRPQRRAVARAIMAISGGDEATEVVADPALLAPR